MTRRKKVLLILLGIAVIVTVLRETGIADFSLCNQELDSNITSSWTSMHDTLLADGSPGGVGCYDRFADAPVEVIFDDYTTGDTGACDHVQVFVSDINYGFVYTPLYKSTNFSCTAMCGTVLSIYDPNDSLGNLRQISLSGIISVTGNFNSFGIMSARKARQTIREYVANEVHKAALARVQTLN
jgi:hypothetical protein